MVVALLGSESDNGRFIVDEMCFAGIPIMSTAPTLMDKDKSVIFVCDDIINTSHEQVRMQIQLLVDYSNRYVLLVSGLNIGSSWCDNTSVQMLIDYICGQIGGYQVIIIIIIVGVANCSSNYGCDYATFINILQDNELCSLITRVIVTGNSVTDKPLQSNINKENKVQRNSRLLLITTIIY